MMPAAIRPRSCGSGPTPNGYSSTASTKNPSTRPTSPPCRSASRRSRRKRPKKAAITTSPPSPQGRERREARLGRRGEIVEHDGGGVPQRQLLVRRQRDPAAGAAVLGDRRDEARFAL